MKELNKAFVLTANTARSSKGRLVIMIITIILFVISAGAPNATIGIGK
jgi:hypothetical protein